MNKALRSLSFAVSLTSITGGANAQLFGDFGTPAWSRAFKYFESRLGAVAKDELVLVLPTATNAAWDDHNKTIKFMEMYKWGDWMPSNAWQYAPNSGKRISDGYAYFLNAAFVAAVDANGVAPSNVKNALKRANEELQFTRGQYGQIVDEADHAYQAYCATTSIWQRKSRAQFYNDQKLDVEISARKARQDAAAETFVIVNRSIVDPDIQLLKQATLRLEDPKQKMSLPPTKDLLGDRDRWQSYFGSYIDKDIDAFLDESNPQTQSITEAQSSSSYFEQRWSASVSVSFLGLFRAGGASAEQVKRENHIKTNTTKIDVSFENLDTFNILRGDWFSENLIGRFASKLSADGYNAVWGPNGQLELIPKTLLVGRGMSLTLYADSQSLDYLYEHFSAGADAGFFIGYWRIGGGGDYSSTKEETKVTRLNDRITFTDLSGRGKVLAVLAKYYAGSVPKPTFLTPVLSAAERTSARKEINEQFSKSPLENQLKGKLAPRLLKDLPKYQ